MLATAECATTGTPTRICGEWRRREQSPATRAIPGESYSAATSEADPRDAPAPCDALRCIAQEALGDFFGHPTFSGGSPAPQPRGIPAPGGRAAPEIEQLTLATAPHLQLWFESHFLSSNRIFVMPGSIKVSSAAEAWAGFALLPASHPAVVALTSASRPGLLQRGDVLVEEWDDDTAIFIIGSGQLRTVRLLDDGQEVWLADVGKGQLIGELAALTGQKRTSTVIAASNVEIFAIDRDVFLSIAERHGPVALALARLLASRLVQTSGHVADLFGRNVVYRVHRELVRLGLPSREPGELVRLSDPPTITDLKQLVHAGREATSRAMKQLEDDGIVIRRQGMWIVMDMPDA
jgi:CRP/FNR family cyclic AMP-dependent transcriptional regulator